MLLFFFFIHYLLFTAIRQNKAVDDVKLNVFSLRQRDSVAIEVRIFQNNMRNF